VYLSLYLKGTYLSDLFDLNMKSDEIMDLLEHFDMEVVYEFDRLGEGTPDSYSTSSHEEGFEFRFDEHQVLETIWCHIRERDEFSPIEVSCIGVYLPASMSEARNHANSTGERITESEPDEGSSSWIRVERAQLWVHYQFDDGKLSLVTLMRPWR